MCRSVFDQTIFNLIDEIIIVLDSSKDKSGEILYDLQNKISKIKIIKVNFGSLSKSRNLGISTSNSKYIAILDGDDFWIKTKLEEQYNAIKDIDKEFGLIYTNYLDLSNEEINKAQKVSVRSFNKILDYQLIKYFCKDRVNQKS